MHSNDNNHHENNHDSNHNNGNGGHQNGQTAVNNNVVTFPNHQADNQLSDITELLGDAPVIQQQVATQATKSETKPTATRTNALATAADFADIDHSKPFARRVGPKTIASSVFAGLLLLPVSAVFLGGGSNSKKESSQQAVEIDEGNEENAHISAEEYAAQQAELEQLRAQQAFVAQQVDAEAIDAAGKARAQQEDAEKATPEKPASTTAATPTPAPTRTTSTTTASRPAPARATSTRVAVTPRATPIANVPRSTPTFAQQPKEPVDPFERRAQLQALGSYGTPPPTGTPARAGRFTQASNPFAADNYYIQTIAFEQPPKPQTAAYSQPTATAQTRQPLTTEELAYQQDASAVLSTAATPEAILPEALPEAESPEASSSIKRGDSAVLDPRRFKDKTESVAVSNELDASSQTTAATPTAILPGTSVEAELPYGISWQEGAPLPELLLMTTEDIMAGELAVIPSGTQFLAQAQIDPSSGVVNIQVVGLFGETTDIQIPRSSIVVRADDGSVLVADATGGPSTPGPNMGGFLMESFGNSLGNVIDGDGSLVGDIAGGVAETWIDNQVERSEANASARASRLSGQPIVWSLDSRSVRLTFNNLVPIADTALRF